MLRIDRVQTIAGISVYGDDADPTVFYALPAGPSFRRDEEGRPVFRYLKYRRPKPRPNGANGGGFAVFDVEFTIPGAQRDAILEVLRGQVPRFLKDRVRLGTLNWNRGKASLSLEHIGGELVSRVYNPGAPSTYGGLVTPFTVEVPEMGATFFAEALKGDGGIVQVAYEMSAWVKLPEVTGYGRFHSEKFYDFVQKAEDDAGCGSDSLEDIVTEGLRERDVIDVHVESGTGIDPKVVDRIRDAVYTTVQEMATKKLTDQIAGYTGDRSVLEDYESIRREVHSSKIYDFEYRIRENTAVLWPFDPRGTLPNITTLQDRAGRPIEWGRHYAEIDLDDPFFRTLSVTVRPNAPFATSPVHSIDVHLEYQGDRLEVEDFHFDSPDQVGTFTRYRRGDEVDYTYSYKINYDTTGEVYRSGPHTGNETELTVNAVDTGVLAMEVLAGNLDPEEISSAAVTLTYRPRRGPVVEEQVVLTGDSPSATIAKVILEPVDQPVSYSVDYRMADGRLFSRTGLETRQRRLFINSPFTEVVTAIVRAAGSFDEIESIFVDLTWTDGFGGYTRRDQVALSKETPFLDWSVPAIDAAAGVLSYSGTIRRLDGTEEEIAPSTATGRTIVVGEKLADLLEVSVIGDLVDWTSVSLVKVKVRYDDGTPTHRQAFDIILTPDRPAPDPRTIEISDAAKRDYSWTAEYHLADGTRRSAGEPATSDPTIVLPRVPVLV